MIARLVRLKLRLLANGFRRSPWQVVGLVIALVYGLAITLLAMGILVALRLAPVDVAEPVVVIGGSIAVLGFLVVPLLLGVDDTLDPRRFALFGIDRTRLAAGLAVAALIGVPALALALISLATVVTWSRSPGAALVALLAAPVTLVLCVLVARISAAGAGLLLATRRSRETIAALAILALVLLAPLSVLLNDVQLGAGTLRSVATATRVLAWTPLGASWAAPASIADGDPAGLAQLAIAVASVGLLALAWRAVVARVLVTPARHGRPQTVAGLGWFGRLPATPLGAVAARSFTYWSRDVRYRVSALIIPITPVALVLVLGFVDVPGRYLALIPVPVVALFAGWLSHNDIAYDSTAIWLHVAAGVRGSADRVGRLLPVLLVGGPLLVAGSIVCAVLFGEPLAAVGLIGVAGALLLGGMGLGAVTSALLPYPVPRPGSSPFQQPNSSNGLTAMVQSLLFLLQILGAAPALVFTFLGVVGADSWYWAALAAGLLVGLAMFLLGLRRGAALFERRGPELLASALRT